MNHISKYVLLFILASIIIGIVYLRVMPEPRVDMSGEEPIYYMDASSLFSEYVANKESADEKYLHKRLQVNGTISEMAVNNHGLVSVSLTGGKTSFGIVCAIHESDTTSIKKKNVGDKITIKGICTGIVLDVMLMDCYVIDNLRG
jgi:hypothetical protein